MCFSHIRVLLSWDRFNAPPLLPRSLVQLSTDLVGDHEKWIGTAVFTLGQTESAGYTALELLNSLLNSSPGHTAV
eukprot:SAG31_NODE_1139_length_9713_cov_28.936863_1_plen_75_part_00